MCLILSLAHLKLYGFPIRNISSSFAINSRISVKHFLERCCTASQLTPTKLKNEIENTEIYTGFFDWGGTAKSLGSFWWQWQNLELRQRPEINGNFQKEAWKLLKIGKFLRLNIGKFSIKFSRLLSQKLNGNNSCRQKSWNKFLLSLNTLN